MQEDGFYCITNNLTVIYLPPRLPLSAIRYWMSTRLTHKMSGTKVYIKTEVFLCIYSRDFHLNRHRFQYFRESFNQTSLKNSVSSIV
jgi:hypothetical protein